MSSAENDSDGASDKPRVREITVAWNGKDYRLTHKGVVEAFDRVGYGDFVGTHGRFYVALNGELKSAEAVFREIVPMAHDEVTQEVAELIEGILSALGFVILDRHAHHE